MAEHVVDVLEAVEVDRERGELVRLLMGLGGVERQPLVEGDAVRQAGHGVVERELMDAVGRFRARAQVDDIGREARAHHQQHGADHGDAEHMRRDQIGRQHDRRIRRRRRGRGRQRVVHGADHEGQHDRRAMAAPARHRPVGAVDRERARARGRARRSRRRRRRSSSTVPATCQPLQGDEMHGEDADAHHEAAGFRRQREMAAADLEADQAGDDGDDAARRRSRPARSRCQARIERQDRDEGRGPQRGAGADGGHEQPADAASRPRWRGRGRNGACRPRCRTGTRRRRSPPAAGGR